MRKSLALTLAVAMLAAAPAAFAHDAGDFYVRFGASNVDPDDNNGSINLTGVGLGNPNIEVDDAWSLTFTGSYQWTANWAVELLAAYPFEHDIKVDGLGKVGQVKHLPPTLSLQYHFMPDKKFQPYVGAGVNYTYFFDSSSEGTLKSIGGTLDVDDNSWGLAGQIGFDYMLNDKWFLNLDFRYIGIETKAKVTLPADALGPGTPPTAVSIKEDVSIDPFVYGINIGYKF